jgi:hypothetical protein
MCAFGRTFASSHKTSISSSEPCLFYLLVDSREDQLKEAKITLTAQ